MDKGLTGCTLPIYTYVLTMAGRKRTKYVVIFSMVVFIFGQELVECSTMALRALPIGTNFGIEYTLCETSLHNRIYFLKRVLYLCCPSLAKGGCRKRVVFVGEDRIIIAAAFNSAHEAEAACGFQ